MTESPDPLLESAPGPTRADHDETFQLLSRVRSGDRVAAGELFARYEDRIRRIVRVRLGPGLRSWAESGDLVQETCRAALEGIGTVEMDGEFEFLSWLAGIATHRIRDLADHLHARKRDVDRLRALGAAQGGGAERALPPDPGTSPSEHAFRDEVRALLDEIVSELPESYREAILLRDYHGASWPEVAAALGSPTVHAAQQLHQRAWIKVRRRAAPRLGGIGPE